MKTRNDFVSNSSSCSFIIGVETPDDVKQLMKPESVKILKEKCAGVTDNYGDACFTNGYFNTDKGDTLNPGDFVRITIGDDSEYDFEYCNPYLILQDIAEKLDSGYGKLKFYTDNDAHISYGEEYNEAKE